MNNLSVIENQGQRVLLTSQLAESYGTEGKVIRNNFNRNQSRYIEGKHFFLLDGDELKQFKLTTPQFEDSLNKVNKLYLWTEKGAFLHAKSLNTDQAWEVYDKLVESYFKMQEVIPQLNNLSPQLQLLINMEIEQNKMKEQLQKVKSEVQGIRDVVAINTTEWRKDTTNILNKIAKQRGGFSAYQEVRKESYELLEARAKCKLSIRLTNLKRVMYENGQPKSKIDRLSKLDVIDNDKRLLEIYTAIVKEMAIKFCVA